MHFFIAAAAPAADAAQAAPELTGIAAIIVTVVTTLVAMFLTPLLRKKAAAETAKLEAETLNANMSTRDVLMKRLKAFLWGTAASFAEKDIPRIAAKIVAGQLTTADQIKTELKNLGVQLKNAAIAKFDAEGIDLISAVGDKALDSLIERAANATSPFPGKDTAKALLQDRVSNVLVEKGVNWMRTKIEAGTDYSAIATVSERIEKETSTNESTSDVK